MRMSGYLFLAEQAMCSVCLLLAAGMAAGLCRKSWWRLCGTGVLTAVVTLLCSGVSGLTRLVVLALTTLGAPLLAWPGVPKRCRLRLVGAGGMLSLWLTGTMRLLYALAPGGLRPLSAASLMALGCAALVAAPLTVRRAPPMARCASVMIRRGSQKLTLTALIDSGNLLRDVITGLPVIVISRQAAGKLLLLPPDGSLLPGMRLMTVRTISGTSLMTIFRTDAIRILQDGKWQEKRAVIGLSPDGYEGFQALVPASLVCQGHDEPAMISQGG